MVLDGAKMQAAHGFPSLIHLDLEDISLAPTPMHIAWISCPNNFIQSYYSIWVKLRWCTFWSHGSVHSSTVVYFKQSAFTLELPRGRLPLCPRPRPGLFQFPLRLEDESETVHGAERVGMLRAQLRFIPCERFALQLCGLAARGGATGAARQTSKARRQANCVVSAVKQVPMRPSKIIHIT